jgi:4-diphosphocytidyl-2-C-methyl-D-erythritol kinase
VTPSVPPPGDGSSGRLLEAAPAKVNLSLRVHGRRPDGYHELESLVVFAEVADAVEFMPGDEPGLRITGPMAGPHVPVAGNLVLTADAAARARFPALPAGAYHLVKRLPAAAGLGGGSADAAAALRLLRRAAGGLGSDADWLAIAASVGSDVPVCFLGKPALMRGRGEHVDVLSAPLPPLAILLANPGVPVSTAAVFRALSAAQLDDAPPLTRPPDLAQASSLARWLAANPNDLEPAALRSEPAVAATLAALARVDGATLVRMSGSGPTCFALFDGAVAVHAAAAAVTRLRAAHPSWWLVAAPVCA